MGFSPKAIAAIASSSGFQSLSSEVNEEPIFKMKVSVSSDELGANSKSIGMRSKSHLGEFLPAEVDQYFRSYKVELSSEQSAAVLGNSEASEHMVSPDSEAASSTVKYPTTKIQVPKSDLRRLRHNQKRSLLIQPQPQSQKVVIPLFPPIFGTSIFLALCSLLVIFSFHFFFSFLFFHFFFSFLFLSSVLFPFTIFFFFLVASRERQQALFQEVLQTTAIRLTNWHQTDIFSLECKLVAFKRVIEATSDSPKRLWMMSPTVLGAVSASVTNNLFLKFDCVSVPRSFATFKLWDEEDIDIFSPQLFVFVFVTDMSDWALFVREI